MKGSRDISKIIDSFDSSNLRFLIHMSGGEPFLHPKFVELCAALIKKHYISMDTNLTSCLTEDFVKEVDPSRVEFISCSLHISTRKNLKLKEDFIKKFKLLKQSAFNAYATQVMYPEDVIEFDKTFKYFRNAGITILPKIFRGPYREKPYPQAYTREEKEKILLFQKIAQKETKNRYLQSELNKDFIQGDYSFKGLPCSAGRKIIFIEQDGTIKRCHDQDMYLGNIFEGNLKLLEQDKVCGANICHCPYFGLNYASGKPKIITRSPYTNYLEKFVYPYTTPVLKPIRKTLRELINKDHQRN